MAIEQELIAFLKDKYDFTVSENDSLIESGLIDSIVLLEVVNFVEQRAGARVPDDAVTPENFDTVGVIGDLYRRLASLKEQPSP